MLPSPASSNNGVAVFHTLSLSLPLTTPQAKGFLEPHVSNLPRRRRLTQLPTPHSDASDDVPDSHLTASSSSSFHCSESSPEQRRPSSKQSSSPSSSHSSQYPRPTVNPVYNHGIDEPPPRSSNGHLGPHVSHIPRRRRPVEVIPGSGVYAIAPSSQEYFIEDDSGLPAPNFEGLSRATVLGKALYLLCLKDAHWSKGLVEGVYMKLHDLGMIPSPWMGALRREGLKMVDQEVKRRLTGEKT